MSPIGADIRVNGSFNLETGKISHTNNNANFEIGDVEASTVEQFAQNIADIVTGINPQATLAVTVTMSEHDVQKRNFPARVPAAA